MARKEEARLRQLVLREGDFVARSLRNLGVFGGDLDDCVQKVFLIAARRLNEIDAGKERAFLFGCAHNTAAHFRRSLARRREVSDEVLTDCQSATQLPDALLDQKRHRKMLDQILESMEDSIRSVFVLYSFEELTMAEIAEILEIPPGTVASRLRRAREIFKQEVLNLQMQSNQESA